MDTLPYVGLSIEVPENDSPARDALRPEHATRLSRAMHTCPHCGHAVRPDDTIATYDLAVPYHLRCFFRRVVQ